MALFVCDVTASGALTITGSADIPLTNGASVTYAGWPALTLESIVGTGWNGTVGQLQQSGVNWGPGSALPGITLEIVPVGGLGPVPDWSADSGTVTADSSVFTADGSGPSSGAGRHRKRYGVRDGDRLLVFDSKAEANKARAAIHSREEEQNRSKPLKRIKVATIPSRHKVLPLLEVRAAAQSSGQIERFSALLERRSYTSLVGLYDAIMAKDEEIARHLLTEDARERRELAELVSQALLHLGQHPAFRKRQ